ncbi:MAG: PAS domain-containing protein [Lachnospiraceae bacterium]|nr:PAS domain-containing protein [Lachnospiraceae bacterium]
MTKKKLEKNNILNMLMQLKGPGLIGKEGEDGMMEAIWFSDDLCGLIGVTLDTFQKLMQNEFYNPIHPEDVACMAVFLKWTGRSEHAVFRILDMAGRSIWLDAVSSPYEMDSGRYTYIRCTDITELKENERRLSEDCRNALYSFSQISNQYRAVSRVNLTQNKVLESYGEKSKVDHGIADYEEVVKAFSKYVVPADRNRFIKAFDRKTLLRNAAEGMTEESLDYVSRLEDGSFLFERGVVTLTVDPFSDEVIGFFTELDRSEEVYGNFSFHTMLPSVYEFVMLVADNHMQLLKSTQEIPRWFYEYVGGGDYEKFLDGLEEIMAEECEAEKRRFLRLMEPETVRRRLRGSSRYSVELKLCVNGRSFTAHYDWFELNGAGNQFILAVSEHE